MILEKKMASAVGAKTARACDICLRRRARFYCGADDALLCQSCDDSVHSANPLARRHERVRLKTAATPASTKNESLLATWHRGPTRKPRTPRHRKKSHESINNHHHHLIVPEFDTGTSVEEGEEDEQLLYRVPVFEYDQYDSSGGATDLASGVSHGFFPPPSDFDMAEFAADVEALLGKGLDGDGACCGIEELGLLMDDDPNERDHDSSGVKVEEEMVREPFELSFDYDHDLKVVVDEPVAKKSKLLLRLDYDAISSSWGSQGPPWMDGKRPDLNLDDDHDFMCLSTTATTTTTTGDCENGRLGLMNGGGKVGGDGGREARVSRYRDKRRTRLFSKKIRYEVRKLNAEKRPRMKGRFVKRSSFPLLAT